MTHRFYDFIRKHAEERPDTPAIIDGAAQISYSQALEKIEKFSGALGSLDLGQDSKLGILCPNGKEYLLAFLGALLKGLPIVPLNFLLTPEDLAFIARDAGIDVLVVDSMFVKPETAPLAGLFKHRILVGDDAEASRICGQATRFEEFLQSGERAEGLWRHDRNPAIPDVILYTSGTTARPKGTMLMEAHFMANCQGVLPYLPFGPEDRVIMALPLFHSFGNIIALIVLKTGGTLVLTRQFAPKTILSAIGQHRATILPLVPTIYSFLVELYARGGYDVSSLRFCVSGGAALPEALLRKVEETLKVTVIEGYGLTETSPVIAVNTFKGGSVPGSVGPALPNVELKIVDERGETVPREAEGEIWVRGPSIMPGYWNRPEETRETLTSDGWLKTGDLGRLDKKNRLYISGGRKKDLIIRAGENVSPLAIENTLMNHPAVAEAAAVGVPHPRMGEQVKVCVVLHAGARAEPAELKEFCRKKLPAFMVPDIVRIYPELPKTASGKVIKAKLRSAEE
ncbi:MAG: AMP-binding protein [Nitrospinae bacterium]|nr:AMP-binding protein [Nitrospinota bacterium]